MRARNYGIRVVYSHTSSISGLPMPVKTETGQTLELKLISEHDTSIKQTHAILSVTRSVRSLTCRAGGSPPRGIT